MGTEGVTPVRLIFRKAPHHAAHSGYHLLARHVQGQEWRPGPLFFALHWVTRALLGPGREERWYPRRQMCVDLAVALGNLAPRGVLSHFLDGEDLLRVSSRMPVRWNNRVVATFHQPPGLLERLLGNKKFIAGLDGAVALSLEQARFLAGYIQKRVHFVPHGVDVDFWKPGGARSGEPRFLAVGAWLRDLDGLGRIVEGLKRAHPTWRFRLVAPGKALERMEGVEGLERAQGLSDTELREEYRRAWAVALPLEDATANNALLEAMACGTPIVTSRVGGVLDYVDGECARLVAPGDDQGFRQALEELVLRPELRAAMGRAGRARAEAFSWERVGARMNQVYRQVLGGSK